MFYYFNGKSNLLKLEFSRGQVMILLRFPGVNFGSDTRFSSNGATRRGSLGLLSVSAPAVADKWLLCHADSKIKLALSSALHVK